MITITSKSKFEIKSLGEVVYKKKKFAKGKETQEIEVQEFEPFYVEGTVELNKTRNWAAYDESIQNGLKAKTITLAIDGVEVEEVKTTEGIVEELLKKVSELESKV